HGRFGAARLNWRIDPRRLFGRRHRRGIGEGEIGANGDRITPTAPRAAALESGPLSRRAELASAAALKVNPHGAGLADKRGRVPSTAHRRGERSKSELKPPDLLRTDSPAAKVRGERGMGSEVSNLKFEIPALHTLVTPSPPPARSRRTSV